MPYKLELPLTESTPYVLIDEENGYLRMKGECYSENTVAFFKDITDWLSSFLRSDFIQFTFDCELEYFNSSSSKLLYNMLMTMDKHAAKGKKIIVNWHADGGNDIIIENGEDFEDELKNVEFNLIRY